MKQSISQFRNYCRLRKYLQLKKISRKYSTTPEYDVIVVGGGHAGTEAATASARMGANTLLVTHKTETIGEMSCNPSFGGVGKGHLMMEVDALDGVCSRICDLSGIQYKILNKTKGPAVWGLRAQIDRQLYKTHLQREVFNTPNLTILASPVEDLILSPSSQPDHHLMKQQCNGVTLNDGKKVYGKTVVLTTGTFLRGTINIGLTATPAGRMDDKPAIGLAKSLEDAGFKMGRLKTGTPPRLVRKTIDFESMKIIYGDSEPTPFSYLNDKVWIKPEDQVLCHFTNTTEESHKVVLDTLHLNKHVKEEINGPRFCPSLESKVLKFKGKVHQVILEPEGLDSDVVYPNGLSCTMPEEDQIRMIRCIPGLQKAEFYRPGYGVEYDYMDPRQLRPSLETIPIQNLFFAGQINGTTGYEEAAAQGLIAGVNAALVVQNRPPFIVDRTEGYIGVLIDDLTTHGTNEPYRMFTSRSEFRISLRPDNADDRLTERGYDVGCVGQYRYNRYIDKKKLISEVRDQLKSVRKSKREWAEELGIQPQKQMFKTDLYSAFELLSHNGVDTTLFFERYRHMFTQMNTTILKRVSAEAKYETELEEQMRHIEQVRKDEKLILPDDLDYMTLKNISTDAKMKLAEARPQSIAAASRIPGMTPAAIVFLLNQVKKLQDQATS